MYFICIGHGNYVSINRVVSIVYPDSAPIKRQMARLREEDRLVDVTCGKPTRALILLDDGRGVLSTLHPETIANRADDKSYIRK